MKKSIKNFEIKTIKNAESIKGGTELNPPRGSRYVAGSHR